MAISEGGRVNNCFKIRYLRPFRISSGAARVESRDGLHFLALEWITACLRLVVSFSFRRALSASLVFWASVVSGFVSGKKVCSHDFAVAPFGGRPR